MIDYQELKRLAEAADGKGSVSLEVLELIMGIEPQDMLGLVRELEHLRQTNRRLRESIADYQQGAKAEADSGDEARAEVRKLKAEVEALHSFIRSICTSTLDMHIAHSYAEFLKEHE